MSATPRTDAAEIAPKEGTLGRVYASFARQLEREVTHWQQRAYGAEDELKTLSDASRSGPFHPRCEHRCALMPEKT